MITRTGWWKLVNPLFHFLRNISTWKFAETLHDARKLDLALECFRFRPKFWSTYVIYMGSETKTWRSSISLSKHDIHVKKIARRVSMAPGTLGLVLGIFLGSAKIRSTNVFYTSSGTKTCWSSISHFTVISTWKFAQRVSTALGIFWGSAEVRSTDVI